MKDDHLPADESWLLSCGFREASKASLKMLSLKRDDDHDGQFEVRLADSELGYWDVMCFTYDESGSYEGGIGFPLVQLHNRGDVSRFCESVGMDLTKTSE